MTQHPSLKLKGAGEEHRSVLKRFERILKLQKEEKWEEGDLIFGLPKVKTTRLKIKKEKAPAPAAEEALATAEGVEGLAPGGEAPKEGAPEAQKAPPAQSGKPDKSKEAKSPQEKGKKAGEKK